MASIVFSGTCSKTDFYPLLEYIDKLKQNGWYLLTRRRIDIGETVKYYYSLKKGRLQNESESKK